MFARKKINDNGRYSTLDHDQGRESHFYFERDTAKKSARVNSLSRDFEVNTPNKLLNSSRLSRDRCRKNHSALVSLTKSESSTRKRSLESFKRLTGSVAFQPANRYRLDAI